MVERTISETVWTKKERAKVEKEEAVDWNAVVVGEEEGTRRYDGAGRRAVQNAERGEKPQIPNAAKIRECRNKSKCRTRETRERGKRMAPGTRGQRKRFNDARENGKEQ